MFASRRVGLLSLCALALLVQHGLVLEAAFDHLGVPVAALQLLLARLGGRDGEDIPKLPTSRGEALDMLAAARRTAPDIPAPPAPAPAPLPVVVVEATVEADPGPIRRSSGARRSAQARRGR